ncbi:MAG TPA: hypothetical protein VGA18_02810 [Rhodothermales bacterium]
MAQPINFDPEFDDDNFGAPGSTINPFLPLVEGNTWTYAHADGGSNTVTVTNKTENILGVKCFEVTDIEVDAEGNPTEVTTDFFATDIFGRVWYFGEDTVANGDPAGTWRAGEVPEGGTEVAQPGVIMLAPGELKVGLTYLEEQAAPQALDQASVKSLSANVDLGVLGSFTDALKTKNDTTLDPGNVEEKYYVEGIGPVLITAGNSQEQLVSFSVANLVQAMASFTSPSSESAAALVTNHRDDNSSSQQLLAPAGHDGGQHG